jgi:diguanylate cyclase (GGDEF)-like protein
MGDQAQKTSRAISLQTYNSILELMRLGATSKELGEFVAATREAHRETPYKVEIYRNDAGLGRAPHPPEIASAMASGAFTSSTQADTIRNIYPLKAEKSCLGCHRERQVGEVLGVVEVEQNTRKMAAEMRGQHLGLFIGYGVLVVLAAAGLTTFAVNRVGRTVRHFQGKIAAINSIDDLKHLDFEDMDFGFRELNSAFSQVETMVMRLRGIAVDKEILALKIKMSNKLIITSEMLRNWRKFVKELLADIDGVVPTHAILVHTQDDGRGCPPEIFWRGNPSPRSKAYLEEHLRAKLAVLQGGGCGNQEAMIHHLADPGGGLKELIDGELTIHLKTLDLEQPKLRGVIGIAVPAEGAGDPVRRLVTESILTTLLNLVGSIQAIAKYTKDLEFFAARDPLTNLHNQRMFWEMLNYEVGRATRHDYRFAVLVLDLDNFKLINDLHGHGVGDSYLQVMAEALRESSRAGDFVTRYGGDEFAIILPETDQEEACRVAGRLAAAINAVSIPARDQTQVHSTCSVGIAVFPEHAQNAGDLFLVADNMMYKAKKDGKNGFALPGAQEVGEIVQRQDGRKRMIIKAIEEGRVVPFFQPIVKCGTQAFPINELLMRIQNGDEFIPAGEFIEVAESMGVLHKLDYLMIEKGFAMAREIDYQGYLFINISPRVFINDRFISWLRLQTRTHGLEPEQIVLEITERETVKNLAMVENLIHALTKDGYKFAIDDFGSGFCSFQYLKRFPVDFIKIEGEFIRNLPNDREYRAFVKSIVTLARELKVRTIGEYVENQEIYDALAEFGIDYGQGYFLGRPQPTLRSLPVVPVPGLGLDKIIAEEPQSSWTEAPSGFLERYN